MNTIQRFGLGKTTAIAISVGLCCSWAGVSPAYAQLTDLAPTPLITSAPNTVKPNLMFILDDSGSMGNDYMPDQANYPSGLHGRFASQCNGLAFKPQSASTPAYQVPLNASGTAMAQGTYSDPTPAGLNRIRTILSAAPTVTTGTITVNLNSLLDNEYRVNDFVTLFSNDDMNKWMWARVTAVDAVNNLLTVNVFEVSGTGTLSNPRVGDHHHRAFFYTYSGTEPALSYDFSTGSLNTTSAFYQQCNSVAGTTPSNGFTRVFVSSLSAAERQNYANWYTYHRTRMLTMRTATSRAFGAIDDRFRIGFSTISSMTVDGGKFLDVSDFDVTQKGTWYSRLFGSNPTGYTPLRGALSKVGQYYAKRGKLTGGGAQTYDPIQFSCQKNFSILTTDGYWNTGVRNDDGTYQAGSEVPPNFGPYGLDGTTAVGQQDGASTPRPMYDGEISTRVVSTPWTRTRVQNATYTRTTTTNYSRVSYTLGGVGQNGCNGGRRRILQQPQTLNQTRVDTITDRVSQVGTRTQTQTYVDGTLQSDTAGTVAWGSSTLVSSSTATGTTTGSWNNNGGASQSSCQTNPTLPSPNPSAPVITSGPTVTNGTPTYTTLSTTAETVGTPTENTTVSGGVSNSLADVAMYYYKNDLRSAALNNCTAANGSNVCTDNVEPRGSDDARHQHMSTFTLGLGVNGTLAYAQDYLAGGSPGFQQIVTGPRNWTIPGDFKGAENIDDLWHTAVNGRGQYFSAQDPASLAQSLNDALVSINSRSGTAAAAATSSQQPIPGDSSQFVTSYTSGSWIGDLKKYQVEPTTGVPSTTADWSARQLLDARIAAGTTPRVIYYMKRGAGNTGTLRPFTDTNLAADGLNVHFSNVCSKVPALSQCTSSGYDVTGANVSANMVSYLRGLPDTRYRTRQSALSDVVGGAPVYVRKPVFRYTENGYQAWASAINATNSGAGRPGTVYVPSNGGMLHAFDGASGQERWAYVPTMVMDRMYRLADRDYAVKHQFLVDATPVVADIYVSAASTWKTIVVGGLGAGGRGYYALDVTDPTNPQALWEFSNDSLGGQDNLGLTFGNPVVTKRADGRWIVVFTSGYNNVSPGDGNGRLFVVDAHTGQRLDEFETFTAPSVRAGSTTAPNGLSKINAWADSNIDNTAKRFYGGDLLGNVWRFDIDNVVAPNRAALRLAYLQAGSPAVPQPITTKPELGTVTQNGIAYPVVYVATGRLLGLSDLGNTDQQSVYAIKDPLTNTPLGDVHANSLMVAQTLTAGANGSQGISNNPVNWATDYGWRVDFRTSGERVNVDVKLAFTTLVVGSNIPLNDACRAGGSSNRYLFDFSSGTSVATSAGVVSVSLGDALIVGNNVLQLFGTPGANGQAPEPGSGGTIVTCTKSDGTSCAGTEIPEPDRLRVDGRRASWRELTN
jgi:type IV pilus assembly protein PilY1